MGWSTKTCALHCLLLYFTKTKRCIGSGFRKKNTQERQQASIDQTLLHKTSSVTTRSGDTREESRCGLSVSWPQGAGKRPKRSPGESQRSVKTDLCPSHTVSQTRKRRASPTRLWDERSPAAPSPYSSLPEGRAQLPGAGGVPTGTPGGWCVAAGGART